MALSATFEGDVTAEGDLVIGSATTGNRPLMNQTTDDAGAYFENSGGSAVILYFDASRTGSGEIISRLYGRWANNNVAQIAFMTGSDTVNRDDGEIALYTSTSGSAPAERVRIARDGGLFLRTVSSNPATKANFGAIFSKDVSSSAEVFVMDEAGNVTQISPHDPESGEWVFYSENTRTGRRVRIDMERMVRSVESITGETFMVESYDA